MISVLPPTNSRTHAQHPPHGLRLRGVGPRDAPCVNRTPDLMLHEVILPLGQPLGVLISWKF